MVNADATLVHRLTSAALRYVRYRAKVVPVLIILVDVVIVVDVADICCIIYSRVKYALYTVYHHAKQIRRILTRSLARLSHQHQPVPTQPNSVCARARARVRFT